MRALGRPEGEAASGSFPSEPLTVFAPYAVLNPNFETAVSALLGAGWDRLYDESAAVVGDTSKPLRARYAASKLVPWDCDTSGWTTLGTLASAIRLAGSAGALRVPVIDDEPPF